MTVTSADVLRIRDELAKNKRLTPAQVVQGVRTLVHARLMEESPMPHLLPDADEGKTDADFQRMAEEAQGIPDAAERAKEMERLHILHVRHRVERQLKAKTSVSVEDHVRFEAVRHTLPGVQDAHHFVQREHGMKLWAETDRLVGAALKEVP